MMILHDLVIVGGGPAGMFAALKLLMALEQKSFEGVEI